MSAKHITISGELGSGKSSVAELVSADRGLELVSTGAIQRRIAASLNLSTLETNLLAEQDRVIDSQVDGVTKDLGETSREPIVFDSRMAWWMVPQALKVRLIVDPDVAAQRIHSRGADEVESYESLKQAKAQIAERYDSEVRRFLARYGVDVSYLKHFDLVIDSSDASAEQVAQLISDEYDAPADDSAGVRLLASPRRVIPAFHLAEDIAPVSSEAVSVIYVRPYVFAVTGRDQVEEAIRKGAATLTTHLLAEGLEEIQSSMTAASFVLQGADPESVRSWADEMGTSYDSYFSWVTEDARRDTVL